MAMEKSESTRNAEAVWKEANRVEDKQSGYRHERNGDDVKARGMHTPTPDIMSQTGLRERVFDPHSHTGNRAGGPDHQGEVGVAERVNDGYATRYMPRKPFTPGSKPSSNQKE